MGKIIGVCTSEKKGTQKRDVGEAQLVEGQGLAGDAHAGPWHRQVSLLAHESAEAMKEKGVDVPIGGYGENLRIEGIDLKSLPIGTKLQVGERILLEVTQIGKVCHDRCAIYYQAGDCIMPREGIFAEVLQGGTIRTGDTIKVVTPSEQEA